MLVEPRGEHPANNVNYEEKTIQRAQQDAANMTVCGGLVECACVRAICVGSAHDGHYKANETNEIKETEEFSHHRILLVRACDTVYFCYTCLEAR